MLALGQISNCYKTSSNTTKNEYTNKSSIHPQYGKSNLQSAFSFQISSQKGRTHLEIHNKTKLKQDKINQKNDKKNEQISIKNQGLNNDINKVLIDNNMIELFQQNIDSLMKIESSQIQQPNLQAHGQENETYRQMMLKKYIVEKQLQLSQIAQQVEQDKIIYKKEIAKRSMNKKNLIQKKKDQKSKEKDKSQKQEQANKNQIQNKSQTEDDPNANRFANWAIKSSQAKLGKKKSKREQSPFTEFLQRITTKMEAKKLKKQNEEKLMDQKELDQEKQQIDVLIESYDQDQKIELIKKSNVFQTKPYSLANPKMDASYQFLMEHQNFSSEVIQNFSQFSQEMGIDNFFQIEGQNISDYQQIQESQKINFIQNVLEQMEKVKQFKDDDFKKTIYGLTNQQISNEFKVIQLLSTKAMLATSENTILGSYIKQLQARLYSKFYRDGAYKVNGKKYSLAQLIYNSEQKMNFFTFKDLTCFNQTAVQLQKWFDSDSEFINANYIKSSYQEELFDQNKENPSGLMIATKSPNSDEIQQFWKMVNQQNISKIICISPENQIKDWQYFPIDSEIEIQNQEYNFSIIIKNIVSKQTLQEHVDRRHFQIQFEFKNEDYKYEKEIEHIHFKSWSDQIPQNIDAINMLLDISENDCADFISKEYMKIQNGDQFVNRLLVHCDDGIGRTGTLLTIINAITNLKSQKSKDPCLSLFSELRRLREQRGGLCETQDQYNFIYKALRIYQHKQDLL